MKCSECGLIGPDGITCMWEPMCPGDCAPCEVDDYDEPELDMDP